MDLNKKQLQRFWSYVDIQDDNDCWRWKKFTCPKGYGHVGFRIAGVDKKFSAHRTALILTTGKMGDLHVLHSCDVPSCCNPKHLRWGTNSENMKDRNERNELWRVRVGNSGRRNREKAQKLTLEQANEIRKLISEGVTQQKCADLYKIGISTVNCIHQNKRYKNE